MSTLNVDKVDPSSGTALEIGSSGDTGTVPSGATLTLTSATLNLPTTITSTTEVKTNKISPATGVAFALGDSGDTFTVPSGATIVNSGTATGFGITAASFRPNVNPLIINGDMAVAQRSTSVAGIPTGSPGTYNTSDRWSTRNDTAGTWTQTQEALTADEAYEDGFSTALKLDCTTADASLDANDMIRLMYVAEGQNLQLLKFGSSTAEALTVAFWVKATKTGINALSMLEETTNRSCNKTYTVDTTNTWEKKVISFPGDTSGGIDDDNTASMWLNFFIAAGTNYTSGTLNETWATNSNANRAVGQVNNADSTSNNFHITGVQFEVGEYTSATIPPFQHESYGNSLERCCRYYQTCENFTGCANDTNNFLGNAPKQFRMRIDNPTLGNPTTIQITDFYSADVNQASTGTISSLCDSPDKLLLYLGGFGGALTAGRAMGGTRNNANDNHITMDAEL